MTESLDDVDSLKSLKNVLVVDPRNEPLSLDEWHSWVDDISLNESVPKVVRQLFENAKNVALYSYFAYRLHQSAELVGYVALEKALQVKYEIEKNSFKIKRPERLQDYLNLAIKSGWIKDEGYESVRPLAASRVEHNWIIRMISEGRVGNEPILIPEPSDEDVIAEMRSMNIAEKRLHGGRKLRNSLAHGESGLAPTAIATLSGIAESINQLFSS